MTEKLPYSNELPTIYKEVILNNLLGKAEGLGIDVDELGLEDLLGGDDNDFIGNLVTLALERGIDHEEFLTMLGVPLERAIASEDDQE